jgi:hypothetical protein
MTPKRSINRYDLRVLYGEGFRTTMLLNLPNYFGRKNLACLNCVLRLRLPTGGSVTRSLAQALGI